MSETYKLENVKHRARGRWESILPAVAGVSKDYLDNRPKACPICGAGDDRFVFDNKNGDGTWICRKAHGSGDGFEMVAKMLNIDLNSAVRLVADHLGDCKPIQYAKLEPRWKYAGPLTTEQIDEMNSGAVVVWNPKKELEPEYNGSRLRPVLVSIYRTLEREPVGAVLRIEINGKKITPSVCNATDGTTTRLVMMAMPDPRPLLGSETVSGERPVLVVEGEKTWQAVRDKMPGWEVVTFGGSTAHKKADWSILDGLTAYIWPDNDDPGAKCASEIREILKRVNAHATIISPPTDKPKGWDLADAFDEGWTADDVAQYISDRTQQVAEPSMPVTAVYSWPDQDHKGRPLGTIENLRVLLDAARVAARYNVISKNTEILIPGVSTTIDNSDNVRLAHIVSMCNRNRLPVGSVPEFISVIADGNAFNPIATWIRSKPWDGIDRISDFCNLIPTDDIEARDMLVRKWLIGAAVIAVSDAPETMHGVLVLKGGQGCGKTTWARRLAPVGISDEYIATGATIDPQDKDSVSQAIRKWIVELGEVGSTMRKADSDRLKAFVTNGVDEFRRPYERTKSTFKRRTVFIASTNDDRFLRDDTGSRRYWVVNVTGQIDNSDQIDRQQLFAQALNLGEGGERHWLDDSEQALVEARNADYKELCPIAELLDSALSWGDYERYEWTTATMLLRSLGNDRPTVMDVKRAASHLKEMGCRRRRSNGKDLIYAPGKNYL